jgi:serine/threonine-protein kinase
MTDDSRATPPPTPSTFRTFLTELKRRKVYRVAAGYAVVVFAVLEGADLVLPTLGAPDWIFQLLVIVTLVGFPVALILAWAFDITPSGVQPDPAGAAAPRTPLAYKVGGVLASLVIVAGGAYWYLAVRGDTGSDTALEVPTPQTAPVEVSSPRSIAVLPFAPVGTGEDLAYLGDGIAGEILSALSRVPGLRLAARSSTFKLRDEDARTVGERLGVAYVLEGSVQQSGERVRVTASMVTTSDESTLWFSQFEGDLTDVFTIQDSIARGVLEGLALEFAAGGAAPVVDVSTTDVAAYTAYLRGRSAASSRTPAGLREGIAHFRSAVEQDPAFSEAYAALANAWGFLAIVLAETPDQAYPQARAAAQEALRLDPANAEAHAALANVKSDWEWDFSGAEQEFMRALTLQPQYASARQWYAQLLQALGRTDEAIAQAQEAVRVDALSVTSHVALGISYYMARRHEEALAQLEAARQRFPDAPTTHELMGWPLRELGRFEESIAAHRAAVAGGQGLLAEGSLALALATAGRRREALDVARRLEVEDRQFPVLAVRLALVHARLGDLDTAFGWLEAAYQRRDPWLTFLNADPAFDPLRTDPRFGDLAYRIGLEAPASEPGSTEASPEPGS